MNPRHPVIQGVIIIVAALCLAIVANGFASRQRKLVLPGYYPGALKVPPREPNVVPPPARTETAVEAPPVTTGATTTTATTTTIVPMTATIAPPPKPVADTGGASPAAPTVAAKTAAAQPEQSVEQRFPPHPDKAYEEISGADVAWLHAKGALFLDARRTSVFEQGHIPGARSFSVWESDIDEKVNALFNERSDPREQNQPIVVYCSGGECEDSHMLAQKLWGVQFNNVYVYKDGFPDWQKRGGAVKTGGQP